MLSERLGKVKPSRLALAILLLMGAACHSTESDESSRLVPIQRVGEERGEITATLGDETRYLLDDIPHGSIAIGNRFDVPTEGPIQLLRPLPARFAKFREMVTAVKVSLDGTRWIDLAPRVVSVHGAQKVRGITVPLDVAEEWRGREIRIHGTAWAARPGAQMVAGDPFEVPKGSVLEMGGGVLPPGRDGGQVEYEVSACRGEACEKIFSATVETATDRWTDWRVPLDDYVGEEISLHFHTSAATQGPSFAVWSRPTVYAPSSGPQRRNVVLLSIDTLRADHLTTYGHSRDTAPKIRRWFEQEGMVFDNVIAAATTTGPSHMTMFTSLQPSVHGITNRPAVKRPPPLTLAEILRANGYATGAVTENGPLHAGWGFSRGFDSYAENKSADVMLPEGHVVSTFGKAEAWLRTNADKPFFLFLHTFEVHYPYTPPARYAAYFSGAERQPGLPAEYASVLYDREIRYVDDQLSELLRKLDAAGVLEHTIFMVTSDHGEEFLEHGFIGHGANLHREALHVPLMIRGPGVAKATRIQDVVGHVDLMPTILDLLGLPPPEVAMGRSLAAMVRGEKRSLAEAPLYSEAWYETAMLTGGQTKKVEIPLVSVQSGRRKLIRSNVDGGFAYAYFDAEADPGERQDLYGSRSSEVADLKELLTSYEPVMAGLHRRAREARVRFALGRDESPNQVEIDPAVKEKLRALGYVE